MDDLRVAMRALGFKPKHVASIFSLVVAILLLGNLQFGEGDARDVSAYVSTPLVLDQIARLLGVTSEDLAQTLTNKTSYVRKELYTVLMDAEQSAHQRDQFVRDLYAILFAFVVETANHRVAPGAQDPPPHSQIVLVDQPGFQSRGPSQTGSMMFSGSAPLVHAYGQNGFDEFCIHFADEVMHSYVLRNLFEDAVGLNGQLTGDGLALPAITVMDNSACIELLRGAQLSERAHKKPAGMLGVLNKACSSYKSGKSGDKMDEDLVQDLVAKFGVHASFVVSPSVGGASERNLFGINHYAGSCSYDTSGFVQKDSDILDSAFVTLLRNSTDSFVSKLFSGPSLAAEKHSKDENTIVQAQVSSRPLRHPTPLSAQTGDEHPQLDPSKVYPITTQLNFTLSEIVASLDRTRLWTVSCIRPNDSGSPNSFDKRRVKAQIRSLLLPDMVARRRTDFMVDFEHLQFCDRYVPTMQGTEEDRIRQCAQANGWREGSDYVVGHRMIWLSFGAWKTVEDGLRAIEKEQRKASQEGDDGDSVLPDDNTEYTHQDARFDPHGGYAESADNLLLARTGTGGTQYRDPNGPEYGQGGLLTPRQEQMPPYSEGDSAWGSEYGKKEYPGDNTPPDESSKEGGLIVKEAPNAVEEVPTSGIRRAWLYVVWGTTWWIPTFVLSSVGRMKRPDVRLAWREKVAIFTLIFLLNATVVFYIVEFGRLLCPNFDKAWSLNEVAEHTGTNDYWVTIQGQVYDVTNFVQRQHSDISGENSNDKDTLTTLAGADLTGYFPPPLVLGCPDLVSDTNLELSYSNFTADIPTAVHTSGNLQSNTNSKLHDSDWYTDRFLSTLKQYRKGPLVYTTKTIKASAEDEDSPR